MMDLEDESPDFCNLLVARSSCYGYMRDRGSGISEDSASAWLCCRSGTIFIVSLPSPKLESCCAAFRLALCVYIFSKGGNRYLRKQVTEQKSSDETCFKKGRGFPFLPMPGDT